MNLCGSQLPTKEKYSDVGGVHETIMRISVLSATTRDDAKTRSGIKSRAINTRKDGKEDSTNQQQEVLRFLLGITSLSSLRLYRLK